MTREEATIQSLMGHIEALGETIKALEQSKTGHWIDISPVVWKCSECHYIVNRPNNTSFCPNCGARMVESEE